MSTDSLKVLIIAGGLTHERDVSVRSGRRAASIFMTFRLSGGWSLP